MMSGFQIRTDLALEAKENCEAEHETIRGVKVEEQENREAEICRRRMRDITEKFQKNWQGI